MLRVNYIGPIRKLAGQSSVIYDIKAPITVTELIKYLVDQHGIEFEKEICAKSGGVSFYQIIINGNNIHSGLNYETKIQSGDEVLISVPLFGG